MVRRRASRDAKRGPGPYYEGLKMRSTPDEVIKMIADEEAAEAREGLMKS